MGRSIATVQNAAAVIVVVGVLAATTAAKADSPIPLEVSIEPASDARELYLSLSGSANEQSLAEGSALATDPLQLSLQLPSDPLAQGTLAVQWRDGSTSNFPIVLRAAFAVSPVAVRLLNRQIDSTPTQSQVSKACVQTSPQTLRAAFEMFFTCREMALELERVGKTDQPTHRIAMEGWLVGNYQLYTRIRPVSPYGADPDLLERLQRILAAHAERPGGNWKPIRLEDARDLVDLAADEDVRLAGLVPSLIEQGQYRLATQVNAQAVKAFDEKSFTVRYGVTANVLKDNALLLETLTK